MDCEFSSRIGHVPPSFLREIFRVIADERIISFAGGLPNPNLFPTAAFARAMQATLDESARSALQYGATEGIPELREVVAKSYVQKDDIEVSADHVIITNGSQQGLDLLGKVLVNENDTIAVESPTYLAAIQALSLYRPSFLSVPLNDNGLDSNALEAVIEEHAPKLLYTIPNFQNPTGLTYDDDVRKRVVQILKNRRTVLVEDDPYGEIRFEGERRTPFAKYKDDAVLLGSFSKIVAPGLRLGWIVTRDMDLYDRLLIAKQAADLHTSSLIQHVVYRYYRDNDAQAHIETIAAHYKKQKNAMITALHKHLGDSITHTNPEGGMFIWATLPERVDTAKLFRLAVEEGVAFVPGESFFTSDAPKNTMRLNYSNSTPSRIDEGVRRLSRALDRYDF
ncbi:aspartate aminotransferase [bacterium]|nr:aspartate aminotransferase [bacterium]|tara:strand:+ start:1180 stop:2361 length:1182 start_codon:yes stop_codon:yes gene_type:complete